MQPDYEIKRGICSECGEECFVKKLDLSFSYSGTHCTGGRSGIHYPCGHGEEVSACCEADVVDYDKWLTL